MKRRRKSESTKKWSLLLLMKVCIVHTLADPCSQFSDVEATAEDKKKKKKSKHENAEVAAVDLATAQSGWDVLGWSKLPNSFLHSSQYEGEKEKAQGCQFRR